MINIEDISVVNVFDVCELTTNSDGIGTIMEKFLCSNAVSVAESKYFPETVPQAIYNDEELIGFVMWRKEHDNAIICRFMIDHKFQNRGLGREAFGQILMLLRRQGYKKAVLMIAPENIIAKKLYLSFGFKFTGVIDKGEHYYELKLI